MHRHKQLTSRLSVARFETRTLINSHPGNVERPRQVRHSGTIRDQPFFSSRGWSVIPLNPRIDFLHEADYNRGKLEEVRCILVHVHAREDEVDEPTLR